MRIWSKKLIGDRQFYQKVLLVAVPIMIQNGITNFVSLLDNIMVGQTGTEQMSGVAIINQLVFVFNICIFGGISGASIFGAQFFGCGDHKGVRDTFRFKLIVCGILTLISIAIFLLKGDFLVDLYLYGDVTAAGLQTAGYAAAYLKIMLIGMVPFALQQAYASTLRETGETIVPMKAGICALIANALFNYLLIFGNMGFPQLGVEGAAIATVIARFVEAGIIIGWTHRNHQKNLFMEGVFRNFHIPAPLAKQILIKGSPLLVNELLWASAQAVLTQCYAFRGLTVIASFNIATTISNVFNIVFLSMGGAIAIIVGQLLGAGKMKEAKDSAWKMIAFSMFCCIIMGALLAVCAPFFPKIYHTTPEVRSLAARIMRITAATMIMHAFMHAAYFTLRSGGKTIITFLFDSVYAWCVSIPLAFVLSRYTILSALQIFLFCQLSEIFKCLLGFYLLKKGVWLQNIVNPKAEHS